MRAFYFGIYELGLASLRRLLDSGAEIVGVATKLQEGPHLGAFARLARRMGLPLFATGGGQAGQLADSIRATAPDILVVSGYHRLIPREILDLAPRGGINLHPSLLPRYRGPCPWKWAIVNGERWSGVTVHVMDEGFDTGPILSQQPVEIGPDETGGELFHRLCDTGSDLLARTVARLARGGMWGRAQNESNAGYQTAPTPEDARIDWSRDGESIRNLVRGFNPRPGAWTTIDGRKVQVHSATPADLSSSRPPGTILRQAQDGVLVSAGDGILLVKGTWVGGESLESRRLRPGMRFEDPMATTA
jgi:methionyl-tRNA formyltransferase